MLKMPTDRMDRTLFTLNVASVASAMLVWGSIGVYHFKEQNNFRENVRSDFQKAAVFLVQEPKDIIPGYQAVTAGVVASFDVNKTSYKGKRDPIVRAVKMAVLDMQTSKDFFDKRVEFISFLKKKDERPDVQRRIDAANRTISMMLKTDDIVRKAIILQHFLEGNIAYDFVRAKANDENHQVYPPQDTLRKGTGICSDMTGLAMEMAWLGEIPEDKVRYFSLTGLSGRHGVLGIKLDDGDFAIVDGALSPLLIMENGGADRYLYGQRTLSNYQIYKKYSVDNVVDIDGAVTAFVPEKESPDLSMFGKDIIAVPNYSSDSDKSLLNASRDQSFMDFCVHPDNVKWMKSYDSLTRAAGEGNKTLDLCANSLSL